MQRILTKAQALIFKMRGPVVVAMASQNTIFLRDTHDASDPRQHAHVFDRDRGGVSDEINFRERAFGALLTMNSRLDVRQSLEVMHQLPIGLAFRLNIGSKNQDHGSMV